MQTCITNALKGNKFTKMLDLYIKVSLKCNESVCHSMVVQLFKFSTKDKAQLVRTLPVKKMVLVWTPDNYLFV